MKLHIERTIELIRDQINENLDIISENRQKVKALLSKTASKAKKDDIQCFTVANKKLISENKDFIRLMTTLTTFMEKYKETDLIIDDTSDLREEIPADVDVVFDMTVDGELPFDNLHPLFESEEFYSRLMEHYLSLEAYEKCSELHTVKSINVPVK